jgi:hypothetical protein
MDRRDLQSSNAYSPIEVTPGGIVMDWREAHPLNAEY